MAMRAALIHYGGKGNLARLYSAPKHKKIIEPFAGGAAYALRYYKHDVTLYDQNIDLCRAWWFLQSPSAIGHADGVIGRMCNKTKIDDIIDGRTDPGLIFILRAAANVGTAGKRGKTDTITKIGAVHFRRNTIDKIKYWHKKIRHWVIVNDSYLAIKNVAATWFIDPPYNNAAGALYKHSDIDYDGLAYYCRSRYGQTIVCENEGADWLDFKKLTSNRKVCGKKIAHCESVWENIRL